MVILGTRDTSTQGNDIQTLINYDTITEFVNPFTKLTHNLPFRGHPWQVSNPLTGNLPRIAHFGKFIASSDAIGLSSVCRSVHIASLIFHQIDIFAPKLGNTALP